MKFCELRKKIGTQRDFAKIVGVERSTVSKWEKGNNTPKLKDLQKIATALEVSVSELFEILK